MNSSEETLKNAKAFLEAGQAMDGRQALHDVLTEEPKNAAALLMLAGAYFYDDMYAEAEMVYGQLILIEPGSGMISIALFNTLWKQSKHREAAEEIRRFITVADKVQERETLDKYEQLIQTVPSSE